MEKLIVPSILTVSDVVNLADNVLKITLPAADSDLKFSNLYTKNKQIFDRLVKNQKSTLKSEFTDDLIQGDKNRDLAFICIRDIIGGISLCLIPELAEKATKLNNIIEKIGANLFRLSYKTESALLLTLFVEFDKPENQQLLVDLGILQYYESLKEAQAAFDSLSTQRSDEKTLQNNSSEAATTVVVEMIPALTSLVGMLQLYAELEGGIYSDMFNSVVTCINETNAVARARKTRKQNKPEEEKAAQV
jgi:hypothetical protein